MKPTSISIITFVFLLLLTSPKWAGAQQIPQNRKWVAQNSKYVEFSSAGIHFLSRDPKEGTNSATTALHLPVGRPWRVAFDVQMVPTTGGGMSVHLTQGATELCWLGAGDFYKYISGFLSTGNGNMPFNQPWDTNWHSFAYASDGKMLSLWHNGGKCGETPLVGTPDTISFQSIGMELRVRNVRIESPPANVIAVHTATPLTLPLPAVTNSTVEVKNTNNDAEGWLIAKGANIAEVKDNELHIDQQSSADTNTYASAVRKTSLEGCISWAISFEFCYGSLRSSSTEIELMAKGKTLAAISADGNSKDLTLKDISLKGDKKPFSYPQSDKDWHKVSFISLPFAGMPLIDMFLDGKDLGYWTTNDVPDAIKVSHDGTEMGKQTEVKLRSVTIVRDPNDTLDANVKPVEVVSANTSYEIFHDGLPSLGLLAQTPGVWVIEAELHNHTPRDASLVPYVLLFDDGSSESLYYNDGWRMVQTRSLHDPDVLSGLTQAVYISPIANPIPSITISPERTELYDCFAENSSENSRRVPKFAVFLQVSSPLASTSSPLTKEERQISRYEPTMGMPYQLYRKALKALTLPQKDDKRWIAVPVKVLVR